MNNSKNKLSVITAAVSAFLGSPYLEGIRKKKNPKESLERRTKVLYHQW